ncbi:phosphate acetyltransferase [Buchnera aphidicola]|uniref:Phosphate acetyltransferase n=1 Tax=Buchnera aphidicola subsp. Rhopalosiphum maidis TaxID=118109 RepID=A0A3G2I674_BUCRM|nr:phosphate acetyltransferase [Buchnera aphidicola]AYN24867.1 phosphate acetyltransferase [Buchnera aphidicola (Rhopalosiphum maidis)]
MSRIIMLVPLNNSVSLTTISLSLLYFFNKKKSNNYFEYYSYFSLIKSENTNCIRKIFSKKINILDKVNFSKKNFNSYKYSSLIDLMIKECSNRKKKNELILIKGINKKEHYDSDQINFDIAQNIGAEVILVENLKEYSLKYFKKKEEKINFFLQQKKYKNFLGVIFNKINSPFIEMKYNFIDKLTILKNIKKNICINEIKKDLVFKTSFPVIAFIPWNKDLVQLSVMNIFKFLNANLVNTTKIKNSFIKNIAIFDEDVSVISKKNYTNTLVLVSLSRMEIFFNTLYLLLKPKKIGAILLTGILKLTPNLIKLLKFLIDQGTPILTFKKNTIETLSQLQKFNFNINIQNKVSIRKSLEYISGFFNKNDLISLQKKKSYFYKKTYSPKEFCYRLKTLSKRKSKRIILPESYEVRILKAASMCCHLGIAECILLGDPKKIYNIANESGIFLNKNIEIINPLLIRDKYLSRLLDIRRNKKIDEVFAKKQLKDNVVLATLILESGEVDGLVSGAVNTTANTIRPALQIIKTNSIYSLVSSIFFMLLPNEVLIYGDCAINIEPNAEELAEIAIQSADSAKIFGIEPRIAMLSYSTGYSGTGWQVEKVRNATSIVKRKRPDLIIDGPIQYDAAISKEIAKLKMPYSSILGLANIFIFPDLNSGNITYKAVQRSTDLICIGPMLQGLKKPVNDLSRGASVEDIIYTIALTSIQSL